MHSLGPLALRNTFNPLSYIYPVLLQKPGVKLYMYNCPHEVLLVDQHLWIEECQLL